MSDSDVGAAQARYYGKLLDAHGVGVDAVASGKAAYKAIRYERLCQVIGPESHFSLHDIGFGLGHLYEHLKIRYCEREITYSGSEVVPGFVEHCKAHYPEGRFELYDLSLGPRDERYDYLIFGGTFYHLIDNDPDAMREFMHRLLKNAWEMSERGLAFNVITSFVEYEKPGLYYPDLPELMCFVARELSRYFVIDHATPLFEATICVWRESAISGRFGSADFDRYLPSRTKRT